MVNIKDFKPTRIMGGDLSTKSGLSIVIDGKIVETRHILTDPSPLIPRTAYIVEQVKKFILEHKPDLICLEDYAANAKFNIIQMVTIGSAIRLMVHDLGIPYCDVAPTELKKYVTGNGNAKKPDMIRHVALKWGFVTKKDDLADAVALAMYANAMYNALTAAPSLERLYGVKF